MSSDFLKQVLSRKLRAEEKIVAVNLRYPASLKQGLTRIAKMEKVSRAELVRNILQAFVDEYDARR